jgi:hypothetical protein
MRMLLPAGVAAVEMPRFRHGDCGGISIDCHVCAG